MSRSRNPRIRQTQRKPASAKVPRRMLATRAPPLNDDDDDDKKNDQTINDVSLGQTARRPINDDNDTDDDDTGDNDTDDNDTDDDDDTDDNDKNKKIKKISQPPPDFTEMKPGCRRKQTARKPNVQYSQCMTAKSGTARHPNNNNKDNDNNQKHQPSFTNNNYNNNAQLKFGGLEANQSAPLPPQTAKPPISMVTGLADVYGVTPHHGGFNLPTLNYPKENAPVYKIKEGTRNQLEFVGRLGNVVQKNYNDNNIYDPTKNPNDLSTKFVDYDDIAMMQQREKRRKFVDDMDKKCNNLPKWLISAILMREFDGDCFNSTYVLMNADRNKKEREDYMIKYQQYKNEDLL